MWSPKKAALVWGLIAFVALVVVALVLASQRGELHDSPFASGEKWGRVLGPVIIAAPLLAYFVQKRRIDRP